MNSSNWLLLYNTKTSALLVFSLFQVFTNTNMNSTHLSVSSTRNMGHDVKSEAPPGKDSFSSSSSDDDNSFDGDSSPEPSEDPVRPGPPEDEEPSPHPHGTDWVSGKRVPGLRSLSHSVFTSPQQLLQHLDSVEQQTIRSLEGSLESLVAVAPTFAPPIIKYALDGCGPLPRRRESVTQSKLDSKGIPNPQVGAFRASALWGFVTAPLAPSHTVASDLCVSHEHLGVDGAVSTVTPPPGFRVSTKPKRLFETDSHLTRIYRAGVLLRQNNLAAFEALDLSREDREKARNSFHAGFFCVDKSSECTCSDIKCLHYLQRIIVDARMANAFLENPAQMEIFTLEALFDCFATCHEQCERNRRLYEEYKTVSPSAISKIKAFRAAQLLKDPSFVPPRYICPPHMFPIHTVSADLRHFYHQIPLPYELRHQMAIDLGKQDGKHRIVFPTTWPMGASPAAGIAQAITWSLLLAELESDTSLRHSLGLRWDGALDYVFPWLPLYHPTSSEHCGGIFVLIDNIFVVTTDSTLAAKWRDRVKNSAAKYNAQLKGDLVSLQQLSPAGGTVEFTGINFSYSGRSVKSPVDPDAQLEVPSSTFWSGSFRALASILGQCLWHFRVRGTKLYSLSAYRQLSRISYPTPSQSWDSLTTISGDDFSKLRWLYDTCRTTTKLTSYTRLRQCHSYALLATDASYSEASGARLGFAYEVTCSDGSNLPLVRFSSPPIHRRSQIALEELLAVVEALEHMRGNLGDNMPDLVMLAIDSTHVKGIISNSLARTPTACAYLDRLYKALGTSRLYLTYVKSELNPADSLTRDLPWIPSLWNDVKTNLSNLLDIATQRFFKLGKSVEAAKNHTTAPRQRDS